MASGRRELETRMAEVGIIGHSTPQHGVLRLNIGGSLVHVGHSVLRGEGEEGSSPSRLSNFLQSEWDNRVPRDSDNYIVIDESPSCVKHVIRNLLKRSGMAMGMPGLSFDENLPFDQKAYMPHVSRVLGLAGNFSTDGVAGGLPRGEKASRPQSFWALGCGMQVVGGTTTLDPGEIGQLTATLREWCPGRPARMELIYRASSDGWTAQDFHSRCGPNELRTLVLYRVSNGNGQDTSDSVVGGFSRVPWTPYSSSEGTSRSTDKCARGSFLFMLKDGSAGGPTSVRPVKWGIKQGRWRRSVICDPRMLPIFEGNDLGCTGASSKSVKVWTGNCTYDVPVGSHFLELSGRTPIEAEVFRLRAEGTHALPPPPIVVEPSTSVFKTGLIDLPASYNESISAESYDEDIRSFGVSIADSFVEERVALRPAHIKLAQANAEAAAAADALAALYGPDVAANKGGAAAVVELSVRGTRMTTLRSILQACPDSAFTARFDEDKWPPTEKDVDEHGRRVIEDCRPTVFSKVLDVLRVRKRMGWASDGGNGERDVRVVVKAADREAFEELVHMYFTNHESFIMDLVQHPHGGPKAGPWSFGGGCA